MKSNADKIGKINMGKTRMRLYKSLFLRDYTVFLTMLMIVFCQYLPVFAQNSWDCQIFPSEQKIETDEKSGAKIIFATTATANDNNLYFHDRCWLPNEKMMLFMSDRTGRNEIFVFISQTGELVRLNRENDQAAERPVASKFGDCIYVVRDMVIYKWNLDLKTVPRDKRVTVTEEKLCAFPENVTQSSGLNESCDGKWVSYGYQLKDKEQSKVCVVNVENRETKIVAQVNFPIQHIQFSWTRPDLLSFARGYGNDTAPLSPDEEPHARIWFVNTDTKLPLPAFYQRPGELVTHECWWLNDKMTFIGGDLPEQGHVRVLDLHTGDIRIIGAGAWWPNGEAREMAKMNWWHQSGSPDGRWIAADNWHGIIAIFDAKTTEKKILTQGHRIYGKGAHPHVGWDLTGKSVEFTSNKRGNPDVCIGYIPKEW